MTPIQHSIPANGIELCVFEWEGERSPLLFTHATGFHARVWDAVIEQFAGHQIYSMDMRGHGRTTGGPVSHWQKLADDIAAVCQELGIEGATGIGHSMGAHTLLQTASDVPALFERLVLFDPVILAPEYYSLSLIHI